MDARSRWSALRAAWVSTVARGVQALRARGWSRRSLEPVDTTSAVLPLQIGPLQVPPCSGRTASCYSEPAVASQFSTVCGTASGAFFRYPSCSATVTGRSPWLLMRFRLEEVVLCCQGLGCEAYSVRKSELSLSSRQ